MRKLILTTALCLMAIPAMAARIDDDVQICVKQTRNSPGGPIQSYSWNSGFDAFVTNDARLRWQGPAEGKFYFDKCMNKLGYRL
jgi:hypothetical protein